ncbi:MAG: DMT family transporter [Chryseolinea sp.]
MEDSTRPKSLILLGVLSLIWGTSFILIKQGLKVFSADEVGSLRVVSASLFMLPIALTKVRELTTQDYWKLFTSGMLGIFIPAFLFAAAQTRMESSIAGILNTLTPLFTMLIGGIIFRQRFGIFVIVGVLLGLVGTIILSLTRSGDVTGFNVFALLIVLACFSYGSNLNFIKFKIPDLKALTITSCSLLLIFPLAIVYLLGFTNFTYKLTHTEGAWRSFGFVVLLGFMGTAMATLLFNQLVKITTPMFTSSVTYLIPIVGLMWGILDGERLQTGHFIGMITIIGGVFLASRKK